MKTGERIRDLRIRKGLTQEDLAAKTDISVRTIQRIENGEVDPRAYTLQVIAMALDVRFEMLANEANDDTADDQKESNIWLPLLHLSGLLLLLIPPILIWIWKREKIADMRRHLNDVMNFQLSMTLYLLPCAMFGVFPILIILGLYSQLVILLNTIKVANGQPYKYPMSIRFLKQPGTVAA